MSKYRAGQFIPEEDIVSSYLNYGPSTFVISEQDPEYRIRLSPPFDPSMDFQMYFTFKGPYTTYQRGYIRVTDEDGQNEFMVVGQDGEIIFSDAWDQYTNLGPMSTDFTFNIEKYGLWAIISITNNNTGKTTIVENVDIASLGNKCYILRIGQIGDRIGNGYTIENLVFVNFNN